MPDRATGPAEIPLDARSPVWPFPNSSVLLHQVRAARAVRKPRPSSSAAREGSLFASQCPPDATRRFRRLAGRKWPKASKRRNPVGQSANSLDESLPRRSEPPRSEEHTSELQSPCNLVCRLLLEKNKKQRYLGMVRDRYMSLLSEFSDADLEQGIAEIDERHPGELLEFGDRFAFVLGVNG